MDYWRAAADAVVRSATDAIVATDRDGIIQVWNAGAERIFGFQTGEAVGRSLDLIIPERLRARHWEGFRTVIETGKSRYGDGDLLSVPGLRKDGRQVSVEFTIVPLSDAHGTMTGMVAVMRDVTKRFDEVKALRRELARAAGRTGAAPGSG
jgi:PAS domain S-box-containing protein